MHDDRFDDLTRRWSAGLSRRRFLAIVGAMLVGVVQPAPSQAASPTPTPASSVPPGVYPTPLSDRFGSCPATGKGGDPDLNLLKNRVDVAPSWLPVTAAAILALPQPAGTTKYLANWPSAARASVDRFLGAPVRLEAFVIGTKRSGGEDTNCNSGQTGIEGMVDYHLTLAADGQTWDQAIVTEITPRIRINHPGWTLDAFGGLVAEETPVRVSGWLLLDPRHADYVGQVRGTRWEIHPVLRIEVLRKGVFVDLDTASPAPVPPAESDTPTPRPTPSTKATVTATTTGGDCDPSYPTVCIPPPPPDLNCKDIPFRNFKVLPPDPHGFDKDGNGIGCQS